MRIDFVSSLCYGSKSARATPIMCYILTPTSWSFMRKPACRKLGKSRGKLTPGAIAKHSRWHRRARIFRLTARPAAYSWCRLGCRAVPVGAVGGKLKVRRLPRTKLSNSTSSVASRSVGNTRAPTGGHSKPSFDNTRKWLPLLNLTRQRATLPSLPKRRAFRSTFAPGFVPCCTHTKISWRLCLPRSPRASFARSSTSRSARLYSAATPRAS